MDVIVQIQAGKGVPEGDLQILMSLHFGESSFFYAAFDKILQPLKHSPEVAGNPIVKGFQRFDVLR